MKKLLIINKSFEPGGIQTALVNMLDVIHTEYEIYLAIFNPRGPLKSSVPDDVKLITVHPLVAVLGMTYADCRQYGAISQKLFKILGSGWSWIFGNALPVSFALMFQKRQSGFDTVIAWHQEPSRGTLVAGFARFALKKCPAPMKIAWIHADLPAVKLDTRRNYHIYKKFDRIVAVSRTAMEAFLKAFPVPRSQCTWYYNHVPAEKIKIGSLERENVYPDRKNRLVLFTACRLAEEKGLLRALDAICMTGEGRRLLWYIAGEGRLRGAITEKIEGCNLGDSVKLIGWQSNPYPYMREADYLFVPSLHETFAMTAAEAHALGTPVLAADIDIMREIAAGGDLLCENTTQGLALALENILKAGAPVKTHVITAGTERNRGAFEAIISP
ncbi:MAG: glycosyltransferase [Eubacteriales bacterium]|jgi:glycosyltransferase involved in cell wall biosynthesis|nr:glycosyltransferase [Eubacteriales bacterium]